MLLPIRHWRTTSAAAIISILEQTHTHLELLLIGQAELCDLEQQLANAHLDDKRIRLVARKQAGIVGALNTALSVANGQYIARMDDDDIAYPQRLTRQLEHLRRHPEVELCATKIRFIDHNGTTSAIRQGNRRYQTWLNQLTDPEALALACYAENPMPHPTLLAHHSIFKQLNGYRDCPGPEDHDLVLRATRQGIKMGKPDELLLDWREHPGRLTRTDSRYARAAFVAGAAHTLSQQLANTNSAEMRAVWIAGTGSCARQWHDELTQLGVRVLGFIDVARPGPKREKRHKPVITYPQLLEQRNPSQLVISALTSELAKQAIRVFFNSSAWIEGRDFIMGA